MSDCEYIEAFRSGNQRIITTFYKVYRQEFLRNISTYYHIHNDELLSDVFQETVLRLWKNIQSGKLTEKTLTTPLAGYLYSIGKLVTLEFCRKEGINTHRNVDEFDTIIKTIDADSWFGKVSDQEIAIREMVYAMKEPCAPLLLMFYWDELSWDAIAKQLHYKDANSAKAQKYKCMQKLKSRFLK